ncbi:urease accessory protein UreF [Yoonia sp.]|uniref:urease accessory protein UreF n=1 Tax=Yoonia sp. TaxID=2212373 RepID=UPI0025CCF7CC|nr:urease accessory UreF family protein [Yoonia sp.]
MDLPDMAYPVAVRRAAGLVGLPVVPTAQVWLQGFASNLVQSAQRLMPVGQTAGQRILAGLTPVCGAMGEMAARVALDDIGSATLAVDVVSMQHEMQYSRIFRS